MTFFGLFVAILMLIAVVGVIVVLVLVLVNPKTRPLAIGFVVLSVFALVMLFYLATARTTVVHVAEQQATQLAPPAPVAPPTIETPPGRFGELSDDVNVPGSSERVIPEAAPPAENSDAVPYSEAAPMDEYSSAPPSGRKQPGDPSRYPPAPAEAFFPVWLIIIGAVGGGTLLVLLYRSPSTRWLGHFVLVAGLIGLVLVIRGIRVSDHRQQAAQYVREVERKRNEQFVEAQQRSSRAPVGATVEHGAVVVSNVDSQVVTPTGPRPPEPDLTADEIIQLAVANVPVSAVPAERIVAEAPSAAAAHDHSHDDHAHADHAHADHSQGNDPFAADTLVAAAGFSVGGPKPDWVKNGAGFSADGKTYFTTIAIGPYTSPSECIVHYHREIQNAVLHYIHLPKGSSSADLALRSAIQNHLVPRIAPYYGPYQGSDRSYPRFMSLNEDMIRNRLIKGQYIEKRESEILGTDMYTLHLRLEFDDTFPAEIKQRYVSHVAESRLWFTVLLGGLVVAFIGVFFAYFKLDTWTLGYYTWRLRLGAVMLLLGIFGLGCAVFEAFDRDLWLEHWFRS